jgi:molybdopterin converting factor small subunit
MKIRIVVTGRGYDAADMPPELEVRDNATLAEAVALLRERIGSTRLSASTLVIVAGKHVGTLETFDNTALADGDEIMLLQPVAGG